jgi:hypothetical protein
MSARRDQAGFTLVEVTLVLMLTTLLLGAFQMLGTSAHRMLNVCDRRAEISEKVFRFQQRVAQLMRAGVLSTYKVEATAADVASHRAAAVGAWIDPIDGEARSSVQFQSADGILAMNAASLTQPIVLRWTLDAAEQNGHSGKDDDHDHMIDEGHVDITYDGIRIGLLTGVSSFSITSVQDRLTMDIRTAQRTDQPSQFLFETVLSMRNN